MPDGSIVIGLMKRAMRLRRFGMRGLEGAGIEFTLAWIAVNVKAMARWMAERGQRLAEALGRRGGERAGGRGAGACDGGCEVWMRRRARDTDASGECSVYSGFSERISVRTFHSIATIAGSSLAIQRRANFKARGAMRGHSPMGQRTDCAATPGASRLFVGGAVASADQNPE